MSCVVLNLRWGAFVFSRWGRLLVGRSAAGVGRGWGAGILPAWSSAAGAGQKSVTVADEFTFNWNSSTTLVINTGSGTGGECVQVMGGTGGTTAGYKNSWTAGLNAKVALDIPIPLGGEEDAEAAASLGFTLGFSYSSATEQSLTATVAPNTTEWIAIGQLEDATQGTVMQTLPSGPQSPKTAYKYAPHGSGDSLLTHANPGFAPYSDANLSGLYIDPSP